MDTDSRPRTETDSHGSSTFIPGSPWLALTLATALTAACSEPPQKEMHQAQGAIDAARAAGAETYARAEYDAAREALALSEQAVAARDYRQALSHALDARERASDAAREAADRKAAARSDAERTLAATEAALARARRAIAQAERTRARRRDLAPAVDAVRQSETAVQESRAALANQDYLEARRLLEGVAARLDAAAAALGPPARGRPTRPSGRRR